eukprot:908178_1
MLCCGYNQSSTHSTWSKYLDCEPLPLCVGTREFAIVNIHCPSTDEDHEYGEYMQCMLYWERITEQNIHNKDAYLCGIITEKMERQRAYLVPLIQCQIDKRKPTHIPQYIYELFRNFCDKKINCIDLSCIHDERRFMCMAL